MGGGGGFETHFQAKNPTSPDTSRGLLQKQVGWVFLPPSFLPPPPPVLSAAHSFSGTNLGLGHVPLMFGKSEQPWLRCRERGERADGPQQF